MKFLVDSNVLSEPTRPEPNPRVIEWLRHSLTVATRNTADFQHAGIPLVNPFE